MNKTFSIPQWPSGEKGYHLITVCHICVVRVSQVTMLRNVIKGTLLFNLMYYFELKILITFLGGSLMAFVSPTNCYSVTNPANCLHLNYLF